MSTPRFEAVAGATRGVLPLLTSLLVLAACRTTAPPTVAGPGDDAMVVGRRHRLDSSALGATRDVWVSLPPSYDDTTYAPRRYPVLVLLDGGAYLPSMAGTVHFMSSDAVYTFQIPELIVVGVPHENRSRELTPTHSLVSLDGESHPSLEVTGGGEALLAFIHDELLPWVDAHYRTVPYRILVGHSLGGLLAVHDLLSERPAFSGYVAIDPSLWWDDEVTVRRAEHRLAGDLGRPVSLYLSRVPSEAAGAFDVDRHVRAIDDFVALLGSSASPGLRSRFEILESEHHDTAALPSFAPGLSFLFEGYRPPFYELYDDPSAVAPHYAAVSERIGQVLLPPEPLVDLLGQWALDEGDVEKAVAFFRLNAASYPSSPHAAEALASALEAAGEVASGAEGASP